MKQRKNKISKRDQREVLRKLKINKGKVGEWVVKTNEGYIHIERRIPNGQTIISATAIDKLGNTIPGSRYKPKSRSFHKLPNIFQMQFSSKRQ